MTGSPSASLRVSLLCGSFQLGGSERNVVQIATGLDPARFAVTVLSLNGAGPLRAPLEAHRIPVLVSDWSFDPRRLAVDLEALQRQVGQSGPDILHLFNYPAIYFGLAAGIAAGVPVRVVAIQARDTWKGWTERILDRLVRRAVTLYVADGAGTRRFAIRDQGLDPTRVQLLYDGPDLEGLVPSASGAALRERFGLRPDYQVVGVVARLQDAHKGQSVFLRSVARLPADLPAQFVLVGGGEDERKLRRLADDLSLRERVIFAGPQAQLADVLHALDILVVPSLRYESVPKILLEGMAAGRPIVASRMGDIPEFVADGITGLLVEPGDPAGLAAAIGRLLEHPDEAKALGDQARAMFLARGITRQQSLETLADLYRGLAAGHAGSPGPLLRARMRRVMTLYRLLRLGDERLRWLLGRRPRGARGEE
jgi:glycosyltransferase involved in cell wall biosynthesis